MPTLTHKLPLYEKGLFGHWTINGIPACASVLTLDVKGAKLPCQCNKELFEVMQRRLLEVHADAVCEWHNKPCPIDKDAKPRLIKSFEQSESGTTTVHFNMVVDGKTYVLPGYMSADDD